MSTVSSIFVTHGAEGDAEAPFTVRMALKPTKAYAPRLLRQFCKARNGKRSAPLDPEAMVLSRTADGSDPIAADEDVRFLFDADDSVAFVVSRPKKQPPMKRGFLDAPAPAKPRPAPEKKVPVRASKLKKGFLNGGGGGLSPKRAAAAPAAAPAKIKVDDETYATTPSIQLMPWTKTGTRGAGSKQQRDANVKVLSHRTADIDMKIDAWAESVAGTRREPTAPIVAPRDP